MTPADETRFGNQSGGINISGGTNEFNGNVAGRDQTNYMENGISGAEFEQAFAPLMKVIQDAPPEQKQEATQKASELKDELSKGDKADDGRVAKLLDSLLEMVPGAVSAVAGMFGTPLLAGLVGPVTKFVLDRVQNK